MLCSGTKKVDEIDKKEVYGKHNVLEYWIIDTTKLNVKVFNKKNSKLRLTKKIEKEGLIPSKILTNLSINLKDLLD